MSETSIRFGGFGGQGVVLVSVVLGTAASTHQGNYAVQNQSYGQQARGGECMSEIRISDKEILYPLIDEVDILVVMSQSALQKYAHSLKTGGCLMLDPDLVSYKSKRDDIQVISVPATRIAARLGNRIVANMVILGALMEKTRIVSEDALGKAMENLLPSSVIDLNIKAVEEGRRIISALNLG